MDSNPTSPEDVDEDDDDPCDVDRASSKGSKLSAAAKGDSGRVWSKSDKEWHECIVIKVKDNRITVEYSSSDGCRTTKALPVGHRHFELLGTRRRASTDGDVLLAPRRSARWLTPGNAVEVWSKSQKVWSPGIVEKVVAGVVTTRYTPDNSPNSGAMMKNLPTGHNHLRQTPSQDKVGDFTGTSANSAAVSPAGSTFFPASSQASSPTTRSIRHRPCSTSPQSTPCSSPAAVKPTSPQANTELSPARGADLKGAKHFTPKVALSCKETQKRISHLESFAEELQQRYSDLDQRLDALEVEQAARAPIAAAGR